MGTQITRYFHRNLAKYFERKPLYLDESARKKPNTRKLVELPWQQTRAKMWDEVTKTLCNLDFIQAKAAVKMTYELVTDFNAVLLVIPGNKKNISKEKGRQDRLDKYAQDLIAYSKGEISQFENITSILPWSQKAIEVEINRIKESPSRLDKLTCYYLFLGQEAGILQAHAHELDGLALQQAWNNNNSGSCGNEAEKITTDVRSKLLLRIPATRQPWTPLPQILKRFKGHKKKISAVAISANGKYLISASEDETCIIWDIISGKPLKTLVGHNEEVNSVAITPDGKIALSGSYRFCILWDTESGKVLRKLKYRNSEGINSVAITPDARFGFTGSGAYSIDKNNSCNFWDLKKGKILRTLNCDKEEVNSVAITPDGKMFLYGSYKKIIQWDTESGQITQKFEINNGHFSAVAITPDNKLVLTGSDDETCILWDVESGQPLKTLKGFSGRINSVALTPDGNYAISGSDGNTCIHWDLRNGQPLKVLIGHTKNVTAVTLTPDGKYAVSGSEDNTCILWDLEMGQTEQFCFGHNSNIYNLSASLDGKMAITSGYDETYFTLWDVENKLPLRSFNDNAKKILDVNISPSGNQALSNSEDNSFILWDLKGNSPGKYLIGHTKDINSFAFTHDGKYALSCSKDETCIIWNLETGEPDLTIKAPNLGLNVVTSSPNGEFGIIGLDDGKCVIFELKSGKLVKILESHNDEITAIVFTKDGKYFITGSSDNNCILYDLKSGQILKKLYGNSSVRDVQITPDGNFVLSNYQDYSCILWDLKTGLQVKKIKSIQNDYSAIALINNGQQALIGTYKTLIIWNLMEDYPIYQPYEQGNVNSIMIPGDGKIAISSTYSQNFVWEMKSGQMINLLRGDKYISEALDVTPDGKKALTGDQDGNCILWDTRDGLQIKTLGYNQNAEYRRGFNGYTEEPVNCIKITRDCKRALSGDSKGSCVLWDIEKGKEIRSLERGTSNISTILLNQDEKNALIGSTKNCILWDLDTGKRIITLKGNKADFSVIALTPDGKQLFTGFSEGGLLIWDLKSGKIAKKLGIPDCKISKFSITPMGNVFLTKPDYENYFASWNIISDIKVNYISGHKDIVTDVIISDDGYYALSTSEDNTCILWDLVKREKISQFFSDESLNCLSVNKDDLVLGGGGSGKMYFLKLPSLFLNIKYAIVRQIWNFDQHEFQRPVSDCPTCGKRFEPDQTVLNCISQMTQQANHISEKLNCLDLPAEVWNSEGLMSGCPYCGEILKFSPYISGLNACISGESLKSEGRDKAEKNIVLKKHKTGLEKETLINEIISNDFKAERSIATALFIDGEYEKSKHILEELLRNGFEVLSTRIHLARIALITNDFEEVSRQIKKAWAQRTDAAPYLLARILWFKLLMTMIGIQSERRGIVILRRLRKLFKGKYVVMEWSMQSVLDHMKPKMKADDHALLSSLVYAMSFASLPDVLNHRGNSMVDSNRLIELENFEKWRLSNPNSSELIDYETKQ